MDARVSVAEQHLPQLAAVESPRLPALVQHNYFLEKRLLELHFQFIKGARFHTFHITRASQGALAQQRSVNRQPAGETNHHIQGKRV